MPESKNTQPSSRRAAAPNKLKHAAKPKAAVQPITEQPLADTYDIHAMGAASKLVLTDLGRDERAFLGICQDLYRNNRGSGTPFENFVRTIIRWTTWGHPPKPEDLLDEIKDNFQPDWDLTVHSVKRFMQNYPDVISELQTAAKRAPEQSKEASHAN
jgi:hypothetical protein